MSRCVRLRLKIPIALIERQSEFISNLGRIGRYLNATQIAPHPDITDRVKQTSLRRNGIPFSLSLFRFVSSFLTRRCASDFFLVDYPVRIPRSSSGGDAVSLFTTRRFASDVCGSSWAKRSEKSEEGLGAVGWSVGRAGRTAKVFLWSPRGSQRFSRLKAPRVNCAAATGRLISPYARPGLRFPARYRLRFRAT